VGRIIDTPATVLIPGKRESEAGLEKIALMSSAPVPLVA
jgi:hypothetical protein